MRLEAQSCQQKTPPLPGGRLPCALVPRRIRAQGLVSREGVWARGVGLSSARRLEAWVWRAYRAREQREAARWSGCRTTRWNGGRWSG